MGNEARMATLEEQIEYRVTKIQHREDLATYATKVELQDLGQRVDLCALSQELEDVAKGFTQR